MAMSGPARAQALDQRDGIGARMAALHPLEDQVVAVLQREMEVRHDARFAGEQFEQLLVDFDPVERGHAQPLELREGIEDRAHQRTEARARWAGHGPRR